MGCRCAERADALRRAASAVGRGDVRAVGRDLAFVGRTLTQDARSGDLARAASQSLAKLKARRR